MTAAIAAKPRSYRWPTIIVALLAGHVVLMMWAVFKATADPNFVVIPNYYDKAVNWDKEQARRAASEDRVAQQFKALTLPSDLILQIGA